MDINKEEYLKGLERNSKFEHEYQIICKEFESVLGKVIWSIVREKGNNDLVVKRAIQEFNKRKVGLFKWIIKEIKEGRIK